MKFLTAGLLAVVVSSSLPARAQPAVSADLAADLYGSPSLRTWARPAYPAAAAKEKISGDVKLRVVVDATGQVTSARVLESLDPRFDEVALAAVKTWVFTPGMEKGHDVAACVDLALHFSPEDLGRKQPRPLAEEELPAPAPTTGAEPKSAPPGLYPEILRERQVPGLARFTCRIDAEGRAHDARIAVASHVDFVLPALAALAEWKFRPAMQGDLPVPGELAGEITFDALGATPAEILTANGITAPDGTPAPVAPDLRFLADPVWPIDQLLTGRTGSAAAEFTVSETGLVHDIAVREGSDPACAHALVSALETWIFSRTFSDGKVVSVRLLATFAPKLPEAGNTADPIARLLAAWQANTIGGAKGLDARLTPIFQVRPEYPAALQGAAAPAGKAVIECVIDREGRVRLPRIVSATQDEFGWAAATALSQWVFAPPLRGGQPVDVKVRVPFDFAAPVE